MLKLAVSLFLQLQIIRLQSQLLSIKMAKLLGANFLKVIELFTHPPREDGLFIALKYPSSLGGWVHDIYIYSIYATAKVGTLLFSLTVTVML